MLRTGTQYQHAPRFVRPCLLMANARPATRSRRAPIKKIAPRSKITRPMSRISRDHMTIIARGQGRDGWKHMRLQRAEDRGRGSICLSRADRLNDDGRRFAHMPARHLLRLKAASSRSRLRQAPRSNRLWWIPNGKIRWKTEPFEDQDLIWI
jgi:hypothetical protein